MSTARVEVSPQMRRALVRPSDNVTPRHGYMDGERASEPATVGNHVIRHVTGDENGVGGRLSVEEESDEGSTAEEEDTVPWETTTTDTLPEPIDPIDFIESHPRSYSESALRRNEHLAPTAADGQGHRYENWSVVAQMEDGCRRGRVMKRSKVSRIAQRERQRAPYPLPRQAKAKNAHLRPSPASRKRRLSGRAVRPPQWNASEGDMAQADEMGEGEGRDDGFVDCPEGQRRRNKKRPGGVHMLLPSVGNNSPPSSPSNTPISRRRASSRKSRPKPRPRKPTKQPTLASADISTQETTTPGPGSSETTDENEENQPHGGEEVGGDFDGEPSYEDARARTPKLHAASVDEESSSPHESMTDGLVLEHKTIHTDSARVFPESSPRLERRSPSSPNRSRAILNKLRSNSNETFPHDSNETSDTDLTSLSHPSSPPRILRNIRRLESDLSTAPFSSETSDMETSGNERIHPDQSDKGSMTDLTSSKSTSIDQPSSEAPSVTPAKLDQPVSNGTIADETGRKMEGKPVIRPPVSKKPTGLRQGVANKGAPSPSNPKKPVQTTVGNPGVHSISTQGTASKGAAASPPLTKPKPPLASKPSKPGLKPKPTHLSSPELLPKVKHPTKPPTPSATSKSAAVSSAAVGIAAEGKDGVGHSKQLRESHSEVSLQSLRTKSTVPPLKKIHSETDVGEVPQKGMKSPSAMVRKLAKLYEEKEPEEEMADSVEKSSSESSLSTASSSIKPAVPAKTKRQNLDRTVQRGGSTSPVPPARLKDTTTSESSKASSSSETPLSQNPSPSVSPIPSPAARKKPPTLAQKPTIPPKKTVLLSQSVSTGNIPNGRKEIGKGSVQVERIPETGENKPVTAPRPVLVLKEKVLMQGNEAKQDGPPITKPPSEVVPVLANPDQGPPVPPRKGKRRSTHIELIIPAWDDQIESIPPNLLDSIPKPRISPRRPPPSPPSPRRELESNKRSTIAVAKEKKPSAEPQVTKRHSMFSTNLSTTQIHRISTNYEVCEFTLDFTDPPEPKAPRKPARFRIRNNGAEDTERAVKSPVLQRSKTPDTLFSESSTTGSSNDFEPKRESDSEPEASSTAVRRYTSGSKKIAPPKPPKYRGPDATTTVMPSTDRSTPSSPRSFGLGEDSPPPLPSQPIPKRKDPTKKLPASEAPVLREGSPFSQRSEEERLTSPPRRTRDHIYDYISDWLVPTQEDHREKSPKNFTKARSTDHYEDVELDFSPRQETKSLMFRRSNSDRFKKHKISTLDPLVTDDIAKERLHRTPSLDKLNARIDRSIRISTNTQESSDSDDEDMVVSPIQQGLPKPPESPYNTLARSRVGKGGKSVNVFAPDDEPLYQYLTTAEFLNTPRVDVKSAGPNKSQLEIARQLSQRGKLWCELPEVITSGVLDTLDEEEKKLQEAMFEVVNSEVTYLRSLNVLIEHFVDDPGMNPNLPEGRRVLDKRQHHVIFSNVREVRDVSARFLEDLQKRQRESAVVKNISDILLEYAENHFDCYIRYCSNQIYQTRELQDCTEGNVMFREYLKRLESNKRCQNLSMQSFLLLPMQRITRMPLLILAILNRTPLDHPDHQVVENTLRTVQKLVTACNDGARKMERTEQLHAIHQRLDFGKLKPIPLVSVSRQLERKGTMIQLHVDQKLFGKNRIKKSPRYLFVFTDYLIITKRRKDPKGDDVYKVVDYASRALIEVEDIESHPGVTFPKHVFGEMETVAMATWAVSTANVKNAFLVILLDNAHRTSAKYIFLAQNHTDKTRWMESITRPEVQKEGEKIYQHWDCPQVQAIYDYEAQQPDELSLLRGDVIKVYRKMADGWYEGERLRDLHWGWFPSNFIVEIANEHTRARNMRETHKLLSLPFSPEELSARMQNIS